MQNFNATLPDQKVFVDLMSIAKKDSEIKGQLIDILSLENNKRKSKLDVLLNHTKLQNAPKEFRKIFTFFLDDIFAREVLQYLKKL
jgi:hypothetical protein